MPPPSPQSFDPGLVTIIVACVGLFGGVLVAIINRSGNRKTQVALEMANLVTAYQKRHEDDLEEIQTLKVELRECESLRRTEFEASVRKIFPEIEPPKELDP